MPMSSVFYALPMKKVVILSAFLSPFRSGAEACAEEVSARLGDRFDITIITAKLRRDLPRNDRLREKVPVIRIGLGHPIDKWLFPFLAPFAARKLHPDIIHAVLESFAGLALFFCRLIARGPKRMLTLQTTNRNFLRGPIIRWPHRVTAISIALQKQAAEYGRTDVAVIPNGIPYAAVRSACDRVGKVEGRMLFVGRLEYMKGVDVLLQACATLHSPLSALHIVGTGSREAELKNICDRLQLTDRVRFLGHLSGPDLLREYAEAEIFCGLSRSEALGNVFLEAQAAGCCVVGTRVGGIPEIIRDGETGILVPPENPAAAAGALAKLLSDRVLRAHLASNAVIHAEAYDWDIIAERYASTYDSLAHRL